MKNLDLGIIGLLFIVAGFGLTILGVIDFVDSKVTDVDVAHSDATPIETVLMAGGLVALGIILTATTRREAKSANPSSESAGNGVRGVEAQVD